MPINGHRFIIFVGMMCITITTRTMQEEKEYTFKNDAVIPEQGNSYETYVTTLSNKQQIVAKKCVDANNKETIKYYIVDEGVLVHLTNKDNDPIMFDTFKHAYDASHPTQN
jgi:hypothetical protein